MDRNILDRTAAALAALDFSTENAEVASLQEEVARNRDAIDVAEARCREISKALRDRQGPDPVAVADALLDGALAIDAAATGPGEQEMRQETASLRAGIGELARRNEDARREIDAVRERAFRRASDSAKPMVEAITGDMRAAAERLLQGFAAISAIHEAARGHGLVRLAAQNAVGGLMGMDKLLSSRREIDVPADVVGAISALRDKGAALPARIISCVPV